MSIRVSIEAKRGCGFRKPGGLYLMGDPTTLVPCGRLPARLDVCPTCRHGVKATRGFTWVNPQALITGPCGFTDCTHDVPTVARCPLDPRRIMDKAGLVWIGSRFYPTPTDWLKEAAVMGASRRIPAVPKGFKAGDTWLFVAHRECFADTPRAGIFHAYRPQRIEYVVRGNETDKELQDLRDRDIEPVKVVHKRGPLLDTPGIDA